MHGLAHAHTHTHTSPGCFSMCAQGDTAGSLNALWRRNRLAATMPSCRCPQLRADTQYGTSKLANRVIRHRARSQQSVSSGGAGYSQKTQLRIHQPASIKGVEIGGQGRATAGDADVQGLHVDPDRKVQTSPLCAACPFPRSFSRNCAPCRSGDMHYQKLKSQLLSAMVRGSPRGRSRWPWTSATQGSCISLQNEKELNDLRYCSYSQWKP